MKFCSPRITSLLAGVALLLTSMASHAGLSIKFGYNSFGHYPSHNYHAYGYGPITYYKPYPAGKFHGHHGTRFYNHYYNHHYKPDYPHYKYKQQKNIIVIPSKKPRFSRHGHHNSYRGYRNKSIYYHH